MDLINILNHHDFENNNTIIQNKAEIMSKN